MSEFKISVVVPCYNEDENILALYNSVINVIKQYSDYEIIFVDDGSNDTTLTILYELIKKDSKIKYISLSRNFGHQNALKAGLDAASGDCVISLDADLQHPPALITRLVEKWQQGYDVVYTIRKNSKLPFFKKITSKFYYKIIRKLSDTDIPEGAADFRLLDKKVVNELKRLKENYLFIRGLVSWLGFKQTAITYTAQDRYMGKSKYSFRKMMIFARSGVTSFSTKPLYLSALLGGIIALLSFLYGIYAILASIFTDTVITGWTSLIVSVLFMGGVQLIMIGVLGEYLGKLFIENKRRPNYIIKESNINTSE